MTSTIRERFYYAWCIFHARNTLYFILEPCDPSFLVSAKFIGLVLRNKLFKGSRVQNSTYRWKLLGRDAGIVGCGMSIILVGQDDDRYM